MSGSTPSLPSMDALVIRPAYPDDHAPLERLARLDSQRPLAGRGPVLVAERDGRILAALSVADGRAIADPFAPTADLVALLRLRAAAESSAATSRGVAQGARDLLRRAGATARRRPAFARG
ncbi:MAG TPA: hypothetical protein VFG42_02810 [Baekduia sp.]|uniref:hypothetical protein n=1 Tax=Baekduia sp. TaxID=2600305 RepID=UPI002D797256|nr:hypothetical protein [Baekduia sp.]HET6505699.1 hypothetical protein [Baekduia sp.]